MTGTAYVIETGGLTKRFGDLERLWTDGKVELYTSHVVKEEIDKAPEHWRQDLEDVYEAVRERARDRGAVSDSQDAL